MQCYILVMGSLPKGEKYKLIFVNLIIVLVHKTLAKSIPIPVILFLQNISYFDMGPIYIYL